MKRIRGWAQKFGLGRTVCVLLLVALVGPRIWDPWPLEELRQRTFDTYQIIAPRVITTRPAVIIDIDEDSLSSYGQWPWPRTRIAELVTRLTELGALAIAFDIIFAEPDRLSPAAFVSRRRQLALMLPPGNSNAAATSRRNSGSCNRNLRGEQP